MIIVVVLILAAFVVFRALRNSPKYKGKAGEKHVHIILTQLPEEYTVLDDVILQTSSGTTQIDHIVISKYGVFAIETKNYRGEIYGDDDRQEWTQISDYYYRCQVYEEMVQDLHLRHEEPFLQPSEAIVISCPCFK